MSSAFPQSFAKMSARICSCKTTVLDGEEILKVFGKDAS